jgi:propionyl-CoA carboxylase alpha chain
MLAKLITYGETREEAIEIMINAIDNYLVEGVQTTCLWEYVMEHDALDLEISIIILSKNYNAASLQKEMEQEAEIAALIALQRYFEDQNSALT